MVDFTNFIKKLLAEKAANERDYIYDTVPYPL